MQVEESEKDSAGLVRNKADVQQFWSWTSNNLAMVRVVNVFGMSKA